MEQSWLVSQGLRSRFTSRTWGSFANAAGELGDSERFTDIWQACVPFRETFDSAAWGSFANAAGELGLSDLLPEMLESWNPREGTLLRGEHRSWASFFSAALRTKREYLFQEILHRLESLFDPTRLPHRGTLQTYLTNVAGRIEDKAIAKELLDALHGASCDVDYCFDTLARQSPDDGQFGGAGRCLMRWLINSYFWDGAPAFQVNLERLVNGTLALDEERRPAAWLAMMTRGQDCYYGAIHAHFLQACRAFVSPDRYDLKDEAWIERIRTGQVTQQIVDFYERELPTLGLPYEFSGVQADSPAWELEPLFDYLAENQRVFIADKKKEDHDQFFTNTRERFAQANSSGFAHVDWCSALRLLLWKMNTAIRDALLRPYNSFFHDVVKGLFEERFGQPLRECKQSDESPSQYAREAQAFLDNVESLFSGHRGGDTRPVKVFREVLVYLVGRRRDHPGTVVDVDREIRILAWDGAKQDILVPMFREIRRNAEYALSQLRDDQQRYRVTWKREKHGELSYGLLAVANAYNQDHAVAVGSTRKGLHSIAIRAKELNATAYAPEPGMKFPDSGQPMWEWRIFFPLPTEDA